MKKLSVLAAATIVLLMNTSAQAGDPVTLNITGNVIASPCQVSSDSITKSVDLGQNIGRHRCKPQVRPPIGSILIST